MNRTFTGRHMLIVMLAFFGIVVAVNVAMAMAATQTFGGKVVENSYVASQQFNGWLEEARKQKALGWSADVSLGDDRHVVLDLDHGGRPLNRAKISAVARHPVGRAVDADLAFGEQENGRYRSTRPLPTGRWLVHFDIGRDGRRMRLIETMS